jgi:YYY domain-containing protein
VLLTEELVFAAIFVVFVLIRIGNPDLWHPYYGGEKPMDLAYLNATLRTASFPPYDPWFAGGQMNYYYYGFVFVGALIKLTGIVPWQAYNLAIPALAAMTGLGVFGVVYNWSRRSHRKRSVAASAGLVGAVLAVAAGNLYQVWFVADKLSAHGMTSLTSSIPGVQRVLQTAAGWRAVVAGDAALSVPTGHWYWNASRAIPDVPGAVQPITEFPFFTFLYADLHAHMMALPITVLALAAAVSWVLPMPRDEAPRGQGWRVLRLLLCALAIGALWPTNTWDYPTYGLVAAGAIGIGHWARHGRIGWPWLRDTAITGVALLGLSLALFWPYHNAYVQPYADFQPWRSARTPASAFLIIHFTFLFAIVSWAVYRVWSDLRQPEVRRKTLRNLALAGAGFGVAMAVLWVQSKSGLQVDVIPSPWTPMIGAVLLTLGAVMIARPYGSPSERFGGWLLLIGALLTQFVEYVVLEGDIGRMNTVFKFYIQVWVLWSVLAAVAIAWLAPAMRGRTWGAWWRAAMAVLIAGGLVYTVTATRAKIQDRFPAMGPMTPDERQAFDDAQGPGLSGIAYQDYVVYDDNGNHLRLSLDRDAMQWLMENVEGTPVILEGFREAGYRWGSRYSINTGLPTVIGWDWHQKQQRNAVGHNVVTDRVDDVRTIYDTTDDQLALELLGEYGVEYVIVGQMERAFYDAAGLAKFDRMVDEGWADLVYDTVTASGEPAVRIYRLSPPGEADA